MQRLIKHRESLSTLVMGLAAVMTTWCAFEASKWNGLQTRSFTAAAAARVESTRSELAENQNLQVDLATFLAWAEALQAELGEGGYPKGEPYAPKSGTLSGFLYSRFRKEFRPVVQEWVASRPLVNEDVAPTPFALESYRRPGIQRARELLAEADAKAKRGLDANRVAENYMLTTVLAALAAFFAGMGAKLILPANGLTLLVFALVALFACGVALTQLPVTIL